MDAVEFMEELAWMCEHDIYSSDCDYESLVKAVETLVKAVEMWAAEYPRKTRQDMFLEQWPNAAISEDGCLEVCPREVDTTYDYQSCARECEDCCREFWMEEVE